MLYIGIEVSFFGPVNLWTRDGLCATVSYFMRKQDMVGHRLDQR